MTDSVYSTVAKRAQAPAWPMFQFSVLTCAWGVSATKTIRGNGTEVPFGYAKHFLYKYCQIESLRDFAKALDWLADQPRMFVIRGQLLAGLSGWQRRLLYPHKDAPATIQCPPRRWIALDFDGVNVPSDLGAPDKLTEAGYHIRDTLLPPPFRGVRCVASATASTGRKGLGVARLRLFFALAEAADNEALYQWADALSRRAPALRLDPSVMRAMQPIYTARPLFVGCSDPVPAWGRVAELDGCEDVVALDLPPVRKAKARTSAPTILCADTPDWMLPVAAADAGRGVVVLDTSEKAWMAMRRAFAALDGCTTGRRHMTLNKAAWELARLVIEGELPEALARKAFLNAAMSIDNSDDRYDLALLSRHIDDAFADLGRR